MQVLQPFVAIYGFEIFGSLDEIDKCSTSFPFYQRGQEDGKIFYRSSENLVNVNNGELHLTSLL